MPKIADVLERESRTVDLEQGDFERLLGRRERGTQPADPCGRRRRHRCARDGDHPRPLAAVGRFPGDPSARPAPAASGALAYVLEVTSTSPIRTARTPSRRGRPPPPRTATAFAARYWAEGSPRCGRRTGGTSPIVNSRTVPAPTNSCRRDVVISDAEGNVVATFPSTGMGHRVVPRFHTRRGVGQNTCNELKTIGVYGLDGRSADAAHGVDRVRRSTPTRCGCPAVPHWCLPTSSFPLDGGTPRQLPLPERLGSVRKIPDRLLARRIARRVWHSAGR